jgi:hypothetical protein
MYGDDEYAVLVVLELYEKAVNGFVAMSFHAARSSRISRDIEQRGTDQGPAYRQN